MAEDLELELDEEKGGKSKLPIIIIAVVVLIAAAAGGYFFFMSDDPAPVAEESAGTGEAASAPKSAAKTGNALYVAMPRPFVFNVPGASRDRLVQIKVQLMVRGSDNDSLAKKHIPLIEGTLLSSFSTSTADDLATLQGKEALRQKSLEDVKKAMVSVEGVEVIEQVLFTGFVMQ